MGLEAFDEVKTYGIEKVFTLVNNPNNLTPGWYVDNDGWTETSHFNVYSTRKAAKRACERYCSRDEESHLKRTNKTDSLAVAVKSKNKPYSISSQYTKETSFLSSRKYKLVVEVSNVQEYTIHTKKLRKYNCKCSSKCFWENLYHIVLEDVSMWVVEGNAVPVFTYKHAIKTWRREVLVDFKVFEWKQVKSETIDQIEDWVSPFD